MTLGISITNLAKVLKLASNEDKVILKADEDGAHLQITFQNNSKLLFLANPLHRAR